MALSYLSNAVKPPLHAVTPMKSFRAILVAIAVVAILAASFYGMRAISAARSAAFKASAGPVGNAVTVRTGTVGRADIRNELVFNGDIEPLRTVELRPKVGGRLKSLALEDGTPVEEGTLVEEGQQIAQIDDREYRAQLDNAQAAQAAAQAAVAVAKASLEQQKASQASAAAATASAQADSDDKHRELARQQALHEKGATTQQALDRAETAALQARASLQQRMAEEQAAAAKIVSGEAELQRAEAALAQAAATLEQAELNLAETRIYAPMRGIVSRKFIDPGSMVSSTTSIVTILSMATVKVIISIPVNHLPHVQPGKTTAVMRVDALPGQDIPCVIEKIYPAVNPVTRTAQAEIRVRNTFDKERGLIALRSGMYASVSLLLEEHKNVIAIDSTLPVRSLDKYLVYVCVADVVRAVPVKLGVSYNGLVEVVEGLEEGQEIVLEGQHRLTDLAKIARVNK